MAETYNPYDDASYLDAVDEATVNINHSDNYPDFGEAPDQAYIDHWSDKVVEDAAELAFGADGPEDMEPLDAYLEERYEDSVSWDDE